MGFFKWLAEKIDEASDKIGSSIDRSLEKDIKSVKDGSVSYLSKKYKDEARKKNEGKY